jgi:2-polyprenyl-6-hydroxyphenyl methylase/3-demethylubiquinone-9 3-methyltransferase
MRLNDALYPDEIPPHMNVDPTELQKFNALAQKWWQPDGMFRPLHQLNPLRLEWIESIAPLTGKKVLDVGCGGGILSEALARQGAHVTGIDLADDVLGAAKAHCMQSGLSIDYRRISAEDLAMAEPGTYDIVTCLEVLEHVPDPTITVNACSRLVKPGGTVFFATLNRNPKSFIHAIVGAEYILGLLPEGTHRYERFVTPAELAQAARKAGLKVLAITGVRYSLLRKNFYLTKNVSINYMMACTSSY